MTPDDPREAGDEAPEPGTGGESAGEAAGGEAWDPRMDAFADDDDVAAVDPEDADANDLADPDDDLEDDDLDDDDLEDDDALSVDAADADPFDDAPMDEPMVRATLRDAMSEKLLVRVYREDLEGEGSWSEGLPLAAGDELLLLARLDERIRFDGYEILRIPDITDLDAPAPALDVKEEALRLRGEEPGDPGPIDLSNLRGVFESLAKLSDTFPLVAVDREEKAPEKVHVGTIVETAARTFRLREIDADAEWLPSDSRFPYHDVTCVEFGTGYVDALALVAGLIDVETIEERDGGDDDDELGLDDEDDADFEDEEDFEDSDDEDDDPY